MLAGSGCVSELPPFQVVYTLPEAGDGLYPDELVEIGFSDFLDPESCPPSSFHLTAVHDRRVAWTVDFDLTETDDGHWVLEHGILAAAVEHAVTIDTGPEECTSSIGQPLQPFALFFPVFGRP